MHPDDGSNHHLLKSQWIEFAVRSQNRGKGNLSRIDSCHALDVVAASDSGIVAVGIIAAITSFCASIFIVYSQAWHGKYSLDNDFSGVQKIHTIAVPRVGGIAMVIGIVVAMCMLFFADQVFKKAVHLEYIGKLLLAGFPIFLAGTIEDLTKNVSVKIRLGASILSALLAIWLLGAAIGKLDIWGLDTLLAIESVAVVVTAFVVAGGVNAINIIDGFHGIAASAAIIMLAAMGCIAWQHGDIFVTQLTALGAGTALGFLLVNYPTGSLFAGDGGAYFL
eukprot:gene22578-23781_t